MATSPRSVSSQAIACPNFCSMWSADRRAVHEVTLDGFWQELRRHDRAVIPFRDQRRMHAERRQNAAFDKLSDRNSVAAFEG